MVGGGGSGVQGWGAEGGGGEAVMMMSQLSVDESKRVKHSMDTCHCIRRVGFAVSCESPPTPLSSPTPHPFPSPFSLFVLALLSISAPCVYLTPPPPQLPSNPTSHNHRHSPPPPPPPPPTFHSPLSLSILALLSTSAPKLQALVYDILPSTSFWRKVPENGARSVLCTQTPSTGLRHPSFNHCPI